MGCRISWQPLVLILALFRTKFAVTVTFAKQPAWQHAFPAIAGIATLYGLFSGIFIGILARQLAAYRRAQSRLHAQSGIQVA